MKTFSLISALCLFLGFAGCVTNPAAKVREKTDEAISQGVYATNDSLKVGRFDLATKYSDQTTRLVPPPKQRIAIKGVYK